MQIWYPQFKGDVDRLEKVQRRDIKLVKGFKNYPYEKRLLLLNLTTLDYRRQRNDMIQVFQIFKGFDKISSDVFFTCNSSDRTRGHSYKLYKSRPATKLRANSFSQRTVNNWNELPEEVVSANTIDSFKGRLGRFWINHPTKFSTNLVIIMGTIIFS